MIVDSEKAPDSGVKTGRVCSAVRREFSGGPRGDANRKWPFHPELIARPGANRDRPPPAEGHPKRRSLHSRQHRARPIVELRAERNSMRKLLGQLKEGGRLVGVSAESRPPRAMIVTRTHGEFGHRALFDAAAPVLPGLERAAAFVF